MKERRHSQRRKETNNEASKKGKIIMNQINKGSEKHITKQTKEEKSKK